MHNELDADSRMDPDFVKGLRKAKLLFDEGVYSLEEFTQVDMRSKFVYVLLDLDKVLSLRVFI